MRILWGSNAPWAPTGYGTQTAEVTKRLKAAGHDVAIAANYGLSGAMMKWHDIPVFPAGVDAYSNDIWPAHFVAWARGEPALFLTLFDVWVLHRDYFRDHNLASWTPVDHYPVPPLILDWAREHETIAMSRFGQAALMKAGIASTYIPHAIDRAIFRPLDKAAARVKLGLDPGAFVILMNAANKGNNPPRKAWSENFGALSIFFEKHPEAVAYIHSDVMGIGGVDLRVVAGFWGINENRLHFCQQYQYRTGQTSSEELAEMYAAGDVLLAASYGEGFGIPTIEAQACGLPVIVSDWAASPELVGAGWKVRVQPLYDAPQNAAFGLPIISGIVEALDAAYEARGDPELREAAIAKAAEYDADTVFQAAWVPYLADLEAKLRPPSREERRAARRAKR